MGDCFRPSPKIDMMINNELQKKFILNWCLPHVVRVRSPILFTDTMKAYNKK